jgi:ADP-heptose:LPS heptosyltransferase
VVTAWLLKRTPAHVVLYADPGVGKALQDGILGCLEQDGCDMARVHGIAGKWSIRQSLTFLEQADCVVGPETGPINAAGMLDVPKVCYLSHSSADNLTKHWKQCVTLLPSSPCAPCHRLHSDWTYCPKDEQTGAAACASSISPEVVFKAIAGLLVQKVAA